MPPPPLPTESNPNDEFLFEDEQEESLVRDTAPQTEEDPWPVLIVDDDDEVHRITKLSLRKFRFAEKPVRFISTYSSKEAWGVLQEQTSIAVVFLDVVMESDDAGLQLVRRIREEGQNPWVRIILRTGQPGQAPEDDVIQDYDINDYKTKTELTRERLFTTLTTSLRTYRDILTIEKQRNEVQRLLEASQRFVPQKFLELMQKDNITDLEFGDCLKMEMTMLFADLRAFTSLSE